MFSVFTHPLQADESNHEMRRVDVTSGAVVTLAGSPTQQPGYADGRGTAVSFYYPSGVAMDAAGTFAVIVSSIAERRGSRHVAEEDSVFVVIGF